jgi:hypothetical protein
MPPPPITAARLGADGPLLGAADEAFTRLLTDEGLQAWAAREQPAAGMSIAQSTRSSPAGASVS